MCMCVGEDKGKPDWKLIKEFLLKEGPVKKEQVVRLLKEGITLMSKLLLYCDDV